MHVHAPNALLGMSIVLWCALFLISGAGLWLLVHDIRCVVKALRRAKRMFAAISATGGPGAQVDPKVAARDPDMDPDDGMRNLDPARRRWPMRAYAVLWQVVRPSVGRRPGLAELQVHPGMDGDVLLADVRRGRVTDIVWGGMHGRVHAEQLEAGATQAAASDRALWVDLQPADAGFDVAAIPLAPSDPAAPARWWGQGATYCVVLAHAVPRDTRRER